MHVEILHPAPMTLVPPRGRRPRVVHVAARVEGEVPEVARDAVRPWTDGSMGWLRQGVLRVEGRDGAWAPVTWIGGGPVKPDAFRDLLSGGDDGNIDLRGTPLCAWGDPADPAPLRPVTPGTRGAGLDLDRVRAVHRDGRGRAAAAARAFVAGGYVICGDAVLGRLSPLATGYTNDRFDLYLDQPHDARRLWTPRHVPACPADLDAVVAHACGRVEPVGRLGPWRAAGEGGDPFAGVRVALNDLPGHVRRFLLEAADGFERAAGQADRAEAAREEARALETLQVDGMTGTCGAEDIGEAMRVLGRASAAALAAAKVVPDAHHELYYASRRVAGLVTEVFLPAMPVPALDEADADALSTLRARP